MKKPKKNNIIPLDKLRKMIYNVNARLNQTKGKPMECGFRGY